MYPRWNYTLFSKRVPSPLQIPLSFQLKPYSKQENGYWPSSAIILKPPRGVGTLLPPAAFSSCFPRSAGRMKASKYTRTLWSTSFVPDHLTLLRVGDLALLDCPFSLLSSFLPSVLRRSCHVAIREHSAYCRPAPTYCGEVLWAGQNDPSRSTTHARVRPRREEYRFWLGRRTPSAKEGGGVLLSYLISTPNTPFPVDRSASGSCRCAEGSRLG